MTAIDEYLANNARYAEAFNGPLPMSPSAHLAVVACMDARLNVYALLGLGDGEAHVIRNAGGLATEDALRSLVISTQLLGTREVLVIHHTDCGMLTFTDPQLREKIRTDLGVDTDQEFLSFPDLEQSVRDDVQAIRTSPLLLKDVPVRGFIYDVKTGRIHEVA